jgi:hypothetical protein
MSAGDRALWGYGLLSILAALSLVLWVRDLRAREDPRPVYFLEIDAGDLLPAGTAGSAARTLRERLAARVEALRGRLAGGDASWWRERSAEWQRLLGELEEALSEEALAEQELAAALEAAQRVGVEIAAGLEPGELELLIGILGHAREISSRDLYWWTAQVALAESLKRQEP